MSQIRSLTRSSRVGSPYAAASRANSRAVAAFMTSRFGKEPLSVGNHQLLKLVQAERRLKQFHEGAFTREKRSMRAEQQPLRRNRASVTRILAFDESADPAVAFR